MAALRDVAQLPSGTLLEYTIIRPSTHDNTASESRKLAVCLHPWSWLGGHMNDPVLQLLAEPLLDRGFTVLSYNSRGVGKSVGRASFSGLREVEDLKELVEWATTNLGRISSVLLLGYSYGSLIASMHPVLSDIPTSHILLSYPLGPRHWLTAFHGSTFNKTLETLVRDSHANVLLIYGDEDNFTSEGSYRSWAENLQRVQKAGDAHGKLEVVKIEGASHFWREDGAVARLLDVVRNWAQ